MHVFLSDLHMTDADTAGAVSDGVLTEFLGRLELLARPGEKTTVVFVGDILELLRSEKWHVLWTKHRSAPWSGMGPKFANFRNGHAEACAIQVAEGIRARYANFSARLKALVQSGLFETRYVFGNHDYMVQLSPKLRAIVGDLLALDHDPEKPFSLTYSDDGAAVYATHGHTSDPVNWHREAEGYWALGDAIVLRIVNRFATMACEELGIAPATQTGLHLQEIDNIEPLADIPLYVRWLAETLATEAQRKKVVRTWRQVVDEFLAIAEFDDDAGYGGSQYQAVRQVFMLSRHVRFAELLATAGQLFSAAGTDYAAAARSLQLQHPHYRFILFGHTHEPLLVPQTVIGGKTSFYVNTGCWRRLVTRTSKDAANSFVPRRIASYFRIDGAGGGIPQERYHLYQEWHAS